MRDPSRCPVPHRHKNAHQPTPLVCVTSLGEVCQYYLAIGWAWPGLTFSSISMARLCRYARICHAIWSSRVVVVVVVVDGWTKCDAGESKPTVSWRMTVFRLVSPADLAARYPSARAAIPCGCQTSKIIHPPRTRSSLLVS